MFTLVYAKNPVWHSNDGQQILLTVRFEEINEDMPFNATSFDSEPHGVDIYNRAKAGEFGAIAAYVPPPEPEQPVTQGVKQA
jgi:hypothetical protein